MKTETAARLAVYFNDHLAGSVAAIALIDDLLPSLKGDPLAQNLGVLKEEIEFDQQRLKSLVQALNAEENTVKAAGAWIAEKMASFKLRPDDKSLGRLGLLEALEILQLGIEGKRLLWKMLQSVWPEGTPPLDKSFVELESAAMRQRDKVEEWRSSLVREIFL